MSIPDPIQLHNDPDEPTEQEWEQIERIALESSLTLPQLRQHHCRVRYLGMEPALNYLRARRARTSPLEMRTA